MIFNHMVTVINKYQDDDYNELYTKAYIDGVLFIKDEVSSIKNTGNVSNDKVTIYIPRTAKMSKKLVSEQEYLSDKENCFTLSKGSYIVYGHIDLGAMDINEYKNNIGSLYEITGVSDYSVGSKLDNITVVAK